MKKAIAILYIGNEEMEVNFYFKNNIPSFNVGQYINPIGFLTEKQLKELDDTLATLDDNTFKMLAIFEHDYIINKTVWISESTILLDLKCTKEYAYVNLDILELF